MWYTKTKSSLIGLHIDDSKPLEVQAGGMTNELIIVREHVNNYIQFQYGQLSCTSVTTSGDLAYCTLRDKDGSKNGPASCPNAPAQLGFISLMNYFCFSFL